MHMATKLKDDLSCSVSALTCFNLTNNDLNDVISPGTYYAAGNNSVTNKPNNADAFSLIVLRSAEGWVTQLLYASNNNLKFYVRSCFKETKTWTPWEKIYTSNNRPTLDELEAYSKNGGIINGNVSISGGLAVNADIAIKNSVKMQYNSSTESLDFVFV